MRSDLKTIIMSVDSRRPATWEMAARGMRVASSGSTLALVAPPLFISMLDSFVVVVCFKRGREYSLCCAFLCVYLCQGLSAV